MKRFAIAVIASALTVAAAAQELPRIAIGAGWTSNTKSDIQTATGNCRNECFNGFHIGFDYLFRKLMGPLSLNPGIRFMMDFSKQDRYDVGEKGTYTEQDVESYIQIPVDLWYGHDFDGIEPFIFAGPTLHFGISSRSIQTLNEGYRDVELNYRGDAGYSPFNLLVGGGVGCRFKSLRITARYDCGLLNRWRGEKAAGRRLSENLITVGAAYCF